MCIFKFLFSVWLVVNYSYCLISISNYSILYFQFFLNVVLRRYVVLKLSYYNTLHGSLKWQIIPDYVSLFGFCYCGVLFVFCTTSSQTGCHVCMCWLLLHPSLFLFTSSFLLPSICIYRCSLILTVWPSDFFFFRILTDLTTMCLSQSDIFLRGIFPGE